MSQKVLYFIAGMQPTTDEASAIAALKGGQFDVFIRNKSQQNVFAGGIEPCDFVAGSPPSGYSEVPVWDGAGSGGVEVNEDDVIAVKNSANTVSVNGTAKINGGVVDVELPATEALIANAVDLTVPVTGAYTTKIHATVVNGAITGFVLS